MKNNKLVHPATNGTVSNQEKQIVFIIFQLIFPFFSPTPVIDPTTVWVVDTGNPKTDANRTVVAVPKSMENPLLLLILVIFVPTVVITLLPNNYTPIEIPTPPRISIQVGVVMTPMVPVDMMTNMRLIGAIAFATSFDPCENYT